MSSDPIVFVVDEDAPGREAVCTLVHAWGVRAVPLASAKELQTHYRGEPGCLVAVLSNGGIEAGDLPYVALANRATTADIVRAMRSGAVTVLDKPPAEQELRQAIGEALAVDAERRRRRDEQAEVHQRLASLSEKERLVLEMIVAGRPNKAMANQLGASLRTIENRRREVFTKLKVRSVAELVTLTLRAQGRFLIDER